MCTLQNVFFTCCLLSKLVSYSPIYLAHNDVTTVGVILCATSAIEIIQGPEDVTVNEGEMAIFTCSYSGTNEFPLWFINGSSYSIQGEVVGLPDRHSYSNQRITVNDVQPSDNGSTYSCSFLFSDTASGVATLTVIPTPRKEGMSLRRRYRGDV